MSFATLPGKVPALMEAGFMNMKLPLFPSPPPVPVVLIYQQASHCLTTTPWPCFSFELKEQCSLCVPW